MRIFSLEHSRAAYRADFILYGTAVSALMLSLLVWAPSGKALGLLACVVVGLLGWSAAEYALHRFVLHGLEPFHRWHLEHHARPTALVGTPTLLSATLFLLLVFLPVWWVVDIWLAQALMLGLLGGYLAYAVTHHATHHWHGQSAWLNRRKHWHARHHGAANADTCFGVTSALWDHLLGSRPPADLRPATVAEHSGRRRSKQTGRSS